MAKLELSPVYIKLPWGAVCIQSKQKAVRKCCKILVVIVAGSYWVTAVGVNKDAQFTFCNLCVLQNERSVLKVALPKVMCMVSSPTPAYLELCVTEQFPRGSGPFEVTVHGGARYGHLEEILKYGVYHQVRTAGLIALKLNCFLDHLRRESPGKAFVRALLSEQRFEAALAVEGQLAPQRPYGNALGLAGKLPEVALYGPVGKLVVDYRLKELEPEEDFPQVLLAEEQGLVALGLVFAGM